MNKFIEMEKNIKDSIRCLNEENRNTSIDLKYAEDKIEELEGRIDELTNDQIKDERRIEELEEQDFTDILPYGESFDDIVFTDDLEDKVKDTLDDVLEDKMNEWLPKPLESKTKEMFENYVNMDLKYDLKKTLREMDLEFEDEIIKAIIKGLIRKVYNVIAKE